MPTKTSPNKQVLHVGCGEKRKDSMPSIFQSDAWAEIRLDIDPDVKPDVVASMLEMTDVKTDTMDALWSSHNIEHLYWHDVPTAFSEFFRVIKPGGFVYITCPDILEIAKKIVEKGSLNAPIYQSNAGPITSMDVLYGHYPSMKAGNLFMAHRCGFTTLDLGRGLHKAGFRNIKVEKDEHFNLWARAYKPAAN